MQYRQNSQGVLPIPSRWGIDADIAGRPIVRGTITINSITGNTIIGTADFRGTPIPIQGTWDENSNQIMFDSPYASFTGSLTIYDDAAIRVRHLVLSGRFTMKPPSLQAGESGNWIATTDTFLTGQPVNTTAIPPAGVFLTSDLLYNSQRRTSRSIYW
ncbi:hypothetical protein EJA10_04240 [Mesobacillus subterraneus]|uniref:Uncharacterized protein n=1 Tax=Mesobacillus subterraneus TaxID=285983 RepID=A0A3R9FZJ8_9BACI|nr:hypothetical protein [Mesobacillus subterraneus]RSD28785.1 hypothetical protein EJA10_04240 [Mesobacillus subterraneus]